MNIALYVTGVTHTVTFPMPQHFLLTAAARTMNLASVVRMTDAEVEDAFRRVRWPETNGEPVCPSCGSPVVYDVRRPKGPARWRCKACRADFSVTSGTIFANHKLPMRGYLLAIVIFCNEVKGKRVVSRDTTG
jgi:transposase-like protein